LIESLIVVNFVVQNIVDRLVKGDVDRLDVPRVVAQWALFAAKFSEIIADHKASKNILTSAINVARCLHSATRSVLMKR
jgi:hypothetical protein